MSSSIDGRVDSITYNDMDSDMDSGVADGMESSMDNGMDGGMDDGGRMGKMNRNPFSHDRLAAY